MVSPRPPSHEATASTVRQWRFPLWESSLPPLIFRPDEHPVGEAACHDRVAHVRGGVSCETPAWSMAPGGGVVTVVRCTQQTLAPALPLSRWQHADSHDLPHLRSHHHIYGSGNPVASTVVPVLLAHLPCNRG